MRNGLSIYIHTHDSVDVGTLAQMDAHMYLILVRLHMLKEVRPCVGF